MKGLTGWRFGLGALILVALFSRFAYLGLLGDFIGADEAVGGLMALNIAEGRDFPLLLWEAQYAGTLLSYLGALLFLFLEPSPFICRATAPPLTLDRHHRGGRGRACARGTWPSPGCGALACATDGRQSSEMFSRGDA